MNLDTPDGKINRRGLFAGATAALAATTLPAMAEEGPHVVRGISMSNTEFTAYKIGRADAFSEMMEHIERLTAEQEAENAS